MVGLVVGGAVYLLIRGPSLVIQTIRLARRWQAVRQHRRDLAAWAIARKRAHVVQQGTDESP
jgi:hypothetical protein